MARHLILAQTAEMASGPVRFALKRSGVHDSIIQSRRMAEKCSWIAFQAHPTQFNKKEDHHPDFHGVFVCQMSRREPEQLLHEVLANRKLVLVQITVTKSVKPEDDWGMNERLKSQMDEQGYGLSLIKIHTGAVPYD
jgi:hypothetical protein